METPVMLSGVNGAINYETGGSYGRENCNIVSGRFVLPGS